MNIADFLHTVWPSQGFYCIATTFFNGGKERIKHKVFDTIDEAAAWVDRNKETTNSFYAVHSLTERQVFYPDATNPFTGEKGVYRVRVASNTAYAKAFFLDLDVSATNPDYYSSQADAIAGLKVFCKTVGLPRPMLVSSGGGIHVYFLMDQDIPSPEWHTYAIRLRDLCQKHGLLADHKCTQDRARILRVAKTFNLKNNNKRLVEVLSAGPTIPWARFKEIIDRAAIEADIEVKKPRINDFIPGVQPLDLGSNLRDFPSVTLKAVVMACNQMRRQVELRGNVSEPEWYHTLQLVRHVENGRKLAHKMSQGHPNYSEDETNGKLDQLEMKGIGPTACNTFRSVCGANHCGDCTHVGKIVTPLQAAVYKDIAPPPKVARPAALDESVEQAPEITIPDPPRPYTRLKSGGIAVVATSKDGDPVDRLIYEHDLYPVARYTNEELQCEEQLWHAILPITGLKEFTIPAPTLFDLRELSQRLANVGVYILPDNIKQVQIYMIAYIAQLQKAVQASAQCNHFGWTDDQRQFVCGTHAINLKGKKQNITLGGDAAGLAEDFIPCGTLEDQIQALRFFNHQSYAPHQFFILCGLAAPYFYATGHHGVIVNATGEPGASKSTALYTAASFWGNPHNYPINATSKGATANYRDRYAHILANLPVPVDEITHMTVEQANGLAMGITQPKDRGRLTKDGRMRQSKTAASTIMLCTSNTSIHSILSTDNTGAQAGSMRVLELVFKKTMLPHSKQEADQYLRKLKGNYGHIGPEFMRLTMPHKDEVEERIQSEIVKIDGLINATGSERFWTGGIAAALVAGELAVELGLLDFNIDNIRQWIVTRWIPTQRQLLKNEYVTPTGILTDYLQIINGNTIVTGKGTTSFPVQVPHGQMLAHYNLADNTLWVLKKGFKDYCTRIGANSYQIIEELSGLSLGANGRTARIITAPHIKKVLGAGTEHAKSQSWCFVVDMTHPEVASVVDLTVIEGNAEAPRGENRAALKVVENE